MSPATDPLPTAVGPARTVSRERADRGSSAALVKLALERGDLVGSETAHAPRLRDAETLHQVARPDLSQPRDRLQQVDDAHLADDVVVLALVEHVLDRGRRGPDPLFDGCALLADGGRLLEGGSTLLGSQLWHRHGFHLSVLSALPPPSISVSVAPTSTRPTH